MRRRTTYWKPTTRQERWRECLGWQTRVDQVARSPCDGDDYEKRLAVPRVPGLCCRSMVEDFASDPKPSLAPAMSERYFHLVAYLSMCWYLQMEVRILYDLHGSVFPGYETAVGTKARESAGDAAHLLDERAGTAVAHVTEGSYTSLVARLAAAPTHPFRQGDNDGRRRTSIHSENHGV